MRNFTKLIVVLPCHSLEDFPTHVVADEASSLLANWTAIWHPGLIAESKSPPSWISQDFVNRDLDNALILSPTICNAMATEFDEAVTNEGAYLVDGKLSRQAIFADSIVQSLIGDHLNDDLVNDFFALGYAALQVQILSLIHI